MMCKWKNASIGLVLSLIYYPNLHAFVVLNNKCLSNSQTLQYAKPKRQQSMSTSKQTKQIKRTTTTGKKSASTTNIKNEKSKNRSTDEQTSVTKKQSSSSSFLPNSRSRAPPWQILSKSAQAQNIELEKKRRENSSKQQGPLIYNNDGELDNTDQAPSNSKKSSSSPALFRSDADQRLFNWKRFSPSKTKTTLSFVGSYLHRKIPPRMGVPEIAFLGRSNVGKSSLLNRLTQTQLARVGKTPGATATVNLYALHKASATSPSSLTSSKPPLLGLVDLPGFGYAKLSRERQDAVQMAAESYLSSRRHRGTNTGEALALAILLIDARRIPSEEDASVLAALYDMGIPLIVVATKLDQVVTSSRHYLSRQNSEEDEQWTQVQKPKIAQRLGLPPGQPLGISSKTGQGISELWNIILDACESQVQEFRRELTNDGEEPLDEQDDEIEDASNVFQDSEDIMYDQGYDWIQDSIHWSDGNNNVDYYDEEFEEEEKEEEDPFQSSDPSQNVQMTFQALRKLARQMEQRGEV
jgi:GTP-binding protein